MTHRYENPSWNQGPADLSDFDNLTARDIEADEVPSPRFAEADTVRLPNGHTATILGFSWEYDEWVYTVRQRHVADRFHYAEHDLKATR